jgi:hypothetical protein
MLSAQEISTLRSPDMWRVNRMTPGLGLLAKHRDFTNDDVKIPAGSFPAVAVGRAPPQQSSAQSGAWWSSHIHRRFHKGGIPDSPDHEYRCGAMTTYAGRTIERFA